MAVENTSQAIAHFNEERLKTLLGSDGWETFKAMEIDSCKNFLTGAVTSPLQKVMTNSMAISIRDAAATGTGTALQTLANINRIKNDIDSGAIEQITKQVATAALTAITTRASQLIEEKIMRIIALPTVDEITSKATYYFMQNRKSLSYILKEKVLDPSDIIKEENEQQKSSRFSETFNKISYKASQVSSEITKYTAYAGSYMNMIMSYYDMGPRWVSHQINKQIDIAENAINDYVNPTVDMIVEEKQKFIDKEVQAAAQILVNEYNKQIDKAATELLAKNDKAIKTAKMKVYTQLAKVKIKVMELTGINLPLPTPNFI